MKSAVYLAGKMAGCSDAECHNWREIAKTLLLPDLEIRDPTIRDFRDVAMTQWMCQALIRDDKADIDRCDAVLVRADAGASWGTAMEMIYAFEHGKYVVAFVGPDAVVSPWVIAHAHAVVPDLEAACNLVLLRATLVKP